jgi:hypothetical protein
MSYFDAPPGQRVLREFTLRRSIKGRWSVVTTPNEEKRGFENREAAERCALRETEGDLSRVHLFLHEAGVSYLLPWTQDL